MNWNGVELIISLMKCGEYSLYKEELLENSLSKQTYLRI